MSGAYVVWLKLTASTPPSTPPTTDQTSASHETINPNPTPAPVETPAPAPLPKPTPTPTPTPTPVSLYKNGTYTGSAAHNIYGIVQVKAIIKGGKLSDVQFVQFPNDREHSLELSQMALPILKQEAISVQSAEVDIVSGATETSHSFMESLTAALKTAHT